MGRLTLSFLVFLLLRWFVASAWYEALAVSFSAYTFVVFVYQIGQRIVILECISAIASLEILAVPAITYWLFPGSMPIESSTYFSYALPAYTAFYVGIGGLSGRDSETLHRQYIQYVIDYLQARQSVAVWLFVIGLGGFFLKALLPEVPAFLGALPMYCLLVSTLYAYYSTNAYWMLLVGLVISLLLINTVQTGMFGDLFFWLLFLLIFWTISLSEPITIRAKTMLVSLAFTLLLIIQSIKGEYRYNTWGSSRFDRTANAGLMAELLIDRFAHPGKLLNTRHFVASFGRFNQGIMIGSAMAKVPVHEAYANGEVLLSLVYPLVPRLLWPGKPQTGGYENIRRFTTLAQFENTSINLSPVGEGYVNFGYGGVLFAYLYGWLLRGGFQVVFSLADKMPSIILWLPMLYIGCLTMETDLLSTWGSLVNSALFIGFLSWSMKCIGVQL
ncbi:hypothetical protein [Spirosoma foliorum]|uniref:O-antigen polysaccharide polymerase Wzy n=1 Tax=Spirosoma foliorum TaxID=2710596 RepID=A0A7G5GRF6_9BACT|nr:hypothetical protein [Spirosoma foliorum]QMW01448.1 hypothetical protein H3H32_26320 [Spirosoma foliorum]